MSKKKYGGLFSEPNEVHAFIIGLSEVVCPWAPRFRVKQDKPPEPTRDCPFKYIFDEYHYYVGGRAMGVLAWVGIGVLLMLAIKAVWF